MDPECEYARPVDPSSSYVPTGPADIFAGDRKTACNGASAKPATAVNGNHGTTATNGHDRFMYKGQRVSHLVLHEVMCGQQASPGMEEDRAVVLVTHISQSSQRHTHLWKCGCFYIA